MFDSTKYIPVLEKIIRDAKIKERIENAVELTYCITNELDADKINKAIGLANDLLYGAKASRETLKNLIDDLQTLAEKYEQPALELATGGVVKDDNVVIKGETTPTNIVITMQPGDALNAFPPGAAGSGTVAVNPPGGPKPAGVSGTGGGAPNDAGYAHTIVKPIPPDPKPAAVSGDNITKKKPPSCDISACTRQVDTCCYYCGWHDRCDEHCMMGSIGCPHKKISHTEEPKNEGEIGGVIGAFQRLGQTLGRVLTGEELASGGIVTMPIKEHEEMHGFGHEKQSQILEMVNKALNTVKELSITREALHRSIETDLDAIEKMFVQKNERYGQEKDGFYNFTQGAKLMYGDASPDNTFRTLMGYVSKHIVTLSQPDALTHDSEFEERCLDVAVYMLIARAMKKATKEGANNDD